MFISRDELLINVWGDSELNLKLSISPDGTRLIHRRSRIPSGLTIEAAENRHPAGIAKSWQRLTAVNLIHSFLSDWGKFAALKSILSAKPSHPGPIHSHLSPRFSTPFMQQEE